MMSEFGIFNWSIVGLYLTGTLLLGAFLSRRINTADNYYLGDRSIPSWAIGISVVATYFGALTFLGGPAWSYKDGFSVIFIHVNYPITIFFVINLFLPFFYNSGVASIYEYLERRFGATTRTLMSIIFLFGNFAYSGIMLYTIALVLQFITGMDVVHAVLIIAVVALTYTVLGGISAVIWTDVIQSIILLIGILIILLMLINKLPAGLLGSLSNLKMIGKTDPFNFSIDPSVVATVWTGVVAMSVYHITVYGADQMMIQRALTAKNIGDAKKAYIMMGYCAFLIFIFFFLIGILLYSYYGGSEFDNDNTIILNFISQINIPGLMGIITVAIVAAAMSSLDSSLNSMATVTTVDFYQRYMNKDGSPKHYLYVSRWITLIWAILIVLPAIAFIGSDGSVLEVLSKVGSFLVGAKLSSYILGFYSRHTTEKGLLIGIISGFFSLWYVEFYTDVAWPWYCVIGGIISISIGWVASIVLDGFQTHYHPFTIRGQQELFIRENREQMENGWYLVPGKIDKASYLLLIYFLLCIVALWIFQTLI